MCWSINLSSGNDHNNNNDHTSILKLRYINNNNNRFDERFRGYGWDKIQFYFELYLSNRYKWAVMPNSFIVHLYHPEAPWAKQQPERLVSTIK